MAPGFVVSHISAHTTRRDMGHPASKSGSVRLAADEKGSPRISRIHSDGRFAAGGEAMDVVFREVADEEWLVVGAFQYFSGGGVGIGHADQCEADRKAVGFSG